MQKQVKKQKQKLQKEVNNIDYSKKQDKKQDGFILDQLIDKIYQLLGKEKKPKESKRISTQDTLLYDRMLPSGICKIDEKNYSKTIEFFDINYQLAQNEDKNFIFESYCEFLNYFDSSIKFQLLFLNKKGNIEEMQKNIQIEDRNDTFNDIREEYRTMLKNQIERGNNGIIKTKYITFTIEAENLKIAKQRLEKIESDILNNFKVLGAKAKALDGKERLQVIFDMLNPDGTDKFTFDFNMVKKGGMSTKDTVAPTSFNFDRKMFRMGDYYTSIGYMIIDAPEMSDRMLSLIHI